MDGEFAVIGAGRFGRAVALRLAAQGRSVLVIDRDPDEIAAIAPDVDAAVALDATDETSFAELRLDRFGCVIVAIGAQAIEASILSTALAHQAGVPRIVARAISPLHSRVLRAVGAHEVVNPEEQMGVQLADRVAHPSLISQLEFDEKTALAEVEVPESFVGKSLIELDVRRRYSVSVVALRRQGAVIANPAPGTPLESCDVLVLIGARDSVMRIGSLS